MNITMIGIALATFPLAFPAAAQTVELLHFSQAQAASADVNISEVDDEAPEGSDLQPDLEEALRREFSLLSPAPAHQIVKIAARSAIAVPSWMKVGIPPSSSLAHLLPSSRQACGVGYRPRWDIHPVAEKRRAALYSAVTAIACEAGLAPELLDALIVQESRYDVRARSPVGAIGLTQLMPGTARELGVDAWDVVDNLRGGARYLRRQLDEFGRLDLALAAYNSGPGRVRAVKRVPRIRETEAYVRAIMSALQGL